MNLVFHISEDGFEILLQLKFVKIMIICDMRTS